MEDEHIQLISVVTVCLNAEDVIEVTMESVRNQRFSAVEHIIIDGVSTDNTLKIASRYEPSKIICEPDEGVYHAMQKGVMEASGDVVFFLNAGDEFYDAHVLQEVVRFFDLTKADAVFGNLLPMYVPGNVSHNHPAFRAGKVLDFSYFNNRRLFYNESIHHQTVFYRRKIFDKCGYLCDDSRANGEYSLNCCAFVQNSFTLKHLPKVVCRFALGGISTSDFQLEWQRFKVARDILRARYFPNGPDVALPAGRYEYLYYKKSLSGRIRILLRGTFVASICIYLRRFFRSR